MTQVRCRLSLSDKRHMLPELLAHIPKVSGWGGRAEIARVFDLQPPTIACSMVGGRASAQYKAG
jgi:hypothetical protein